MQTLAEENERFTTELNARAEEAARLRDANGRATAAIRARDDALALAVEARDVAKAAALDAHERAARSAVETVELEEKLRAARSEALRLRGEMERETTDRERRDRAARAATADRDEMATAIEGFRREREFLRAKLRDAAAREEREMERDPQSRGPRRSAAMTTTTRTKKAPGVPRRGTRQRDRWTPARAPRPRRGLARCIFRRSIFRRRRWCWNPERRRDLERAFGFFPLREPVRERRARDGRRACRRRRRGPAPAGGLDPRVALGSGTRAREGEARAGGGRGEGASAGGDQRGAGAPARGQARVAGGEAPRRRGTRRKTFREAPSAGPTPPTPPTRTTPTRGATTTWERHRADDAGSSPRSIRSRGGEEVSFW